MVQGALNTSGYVFDQGAGAQTAWTPIPLPIGARITKILQYVFSFAPGNVTAQFKSVAATSGTPTNIGALQTSVTSTYETLTISGLSTTVTIANIYAVNTSLNGSQLLSTEVTYSI